MCLYKVCKEFKVARRHVVLGLIMFAGYLVYQSIQTQNEREKEYHINWKDTRKSEQLSEKKKDEKKATAAPIAKFKKTSSGPMLKLSADQLKFPIGDGVSEAEELGLLTVRRDNIMRDVADELLENPPFEWWMQNSRRIRELQSRVRPIK